MSKTRILIVNDDPHACRRIEQMLARHDDIDVVATVSDARDALLFIATPRRARYRARFAVQTRSRIEIVPVSAVECIEAAGCYVRLYTAKEAHLVRESMRQLESVLDPAHFARVHRSAIVRIDRIHHAAVDAHGRLALELASGRTVPVGRLYGAAVRTLIGLGSPIGA